MWGFVQSCECAGLQGSTTLVIHLTHDDEVGTCQCIENKETGWYLIISDASNQGVRMRIPLRSNGHFLHCDTSFTDMVSPTCVIVSRPALYVLMMVTVTMRVPRGPLASEVTVPVNTVEIEEVDKYSPMKKTCGTHLDDGMFLKHDRFFLMFSCLKSSLTIQSF